MKKWLIIGIAILVLGGLVFFLVANLNQGTGTTTYKELERKAQVSGASVSTSVIPELKDKIKVDFQPKQEDLKYGFFSGDGKVKNISSQTIEEMVLTYRISGDSREYSLPYAFNNIKPGKEAEFYIGQQKLSSGANSVVFGARIKWSTAVQTPTQPSLTSPPVSVGKEWPIKGTWKIQTSQGELIIIYQETDSSKGKIKFLVDEKERTTSVTNISGQSIQGLWFGRITYRDGKTEENSGPASFKMGEVKTGSLKEGDAQLILLKSVEYWFEIK